jgi:hypothetical protein
MYAVGETAQITGRICETLMKTHKSGPSRCLTRDRSPARLKLSGCRCALTGVLKVNFFNLRRKLNSDEVDKGALTKGRFHSLLEINNQEGPAGPCVCYNFRLVFIMSLIENAADGGLDMGHEESMLGKNGSDHDFFQARFDALTAEERRLLRENIKLGNTKSDAARKKSHRGEARGDPNGLPPAAKLFAKRRGSIGSSLRNN